MRLVFFLVVSVLSGCGLNAVGGEGLDMTTTGSIAPAAGQTQPAESASPSPVIASVAPEDWEAMRGLAATKLPGTATGAPLLWTSPVTGDTGTLVALADAQPQPGGLSCRKVALTVSDPRGVRRYLAKACGGMQGQWQLHDVTAEDMTLVAQNIPPMPPPIEPVASP